MCAIVGIFKVLLEFLKCSYHIFGFVHGRLFHCPSEKFFCRFIYCSSLKTVGIPKNSFGCSYFAQFTIFSYLAVD